MATTQSTEAENKQTTYTLLVVFTVDEGSHEQLRDQQAIRAEAANWIESLAARVRGVSVRKAD